MHQRLLNRFLLFLSIKQTSSFSPLIFLGALGAGALSTFVVVYLIWFSVPFIASKFLQNSISQISWLASQNLFSVWPILFGSLSVSLLGSLIILFVGLGVASLYTTIENKKILGVFKNILVVFSSVPSVIYGLWCMDTIVPFIADRFQVAGSSLLAGSVALAIMIVPHFTLYVFEHFKYDYDQARVARSSLGISKSSYLLQVIIPHQTSLLISGYFLQLARALGETMVVVMVCGNIPQISSSLLEPVRTFTANLALEMGYAEGLHLSALFFSSVVLCFLVIFVLLVAKGVLRASEEG